MYYIKEIEDYWERNAGGPSPRFPGIEYFNVDGTFRSFDLFRELTPTSPEPQEMHRPPDETLRLLDQQGRIFKYAFHKNGFQYPILTEEKPTFEMMKQVVHEMDPEELSEFVSEDKFSAFLESYCE
jgi:hypothetical protein